MWDQRPDRGKQTYFYSRKSFYFVREGGLPERLSLMSSVSVTLCQSRTKGVLIYLLSMYLPGGRQRAYKNFLVSCIFCVFAS